MSRPSNGLCVDSLKLELEARGLSESAAACLTNEFVHRHPFAHRFEMKCLVEDMERRGFCAGDAAETAGMLLGIEMRDLGTSFEAVLRELKLRGLDRGEALASAVSSARIYREICGHSELQPEERSEEQISLTWLALVVLLLSAFALLAG